MDHNLQKAIQLHNQGDLLGAIALYRDLVDAEPENADAWHLFGVAAYQHGSPDLGADLIGNAIELKPGVADYHSNLAMVQKAMGRLADSEASLDKALACNPTHAKALSNLAGLKRMAGEFEATVDLARRAVAAKLPAYKALQPAAARSLAAAACAPTLVCGHAHEARDERVAEDLRWIVLDAYGGARDQLSIGEAGELELLASARQA